MNCTACTALLHDYVDGDVAAGDLCAIEAHLAHCAGCRDAFGALRALTAQAAQLPAAIPPSRDLWPGICREMERLELAPFQPAGTAPRSGGSRSSSLALRWFLPVGLTAAIALLATLAERSTTAGVPVAPGSAWSVAVVAGAPRVASKLVQGETAFRVGQWLETDATSRARVAVGSIGEVSVEPNSRLRLAGVAETNHRLELARGQLSALIWAPPRLFFVDTPSATAVDLGCAYTLTVDDDGNGELHVTTGYVALEHGSRESVIPAGLMCLTRRGAGPGTPFAADAPETFRRALAEFDFGSQAAPALAEILAQARPGDAITLWHLLVRTAGTQRAAVFDTLARHQPPPAGVTRAGIVADDADMRRLWGVELGLGAFAGL